MIDVLIVGAGPAGTVAATVLARRGARVRLLDRATFPRHKLCGDTLNPGTLAALRRLGLAREVDTQGLRIDGMVVTGEGGVAIDGAYPDAMYGRAITRAELDWMLVQDAVRAGASFDSAANVRAAIVEDDGGERRVKGAMVRTHAGEERRLEAAVTIAADGRRSALAFDLDLARHPAKPRRWAVGAYFEAAAHSAGPAMRGEMHIRGGRYIGVAPLPGGILNVCLVKPSSPADASLRDPLEALRAALAADALLADRFREAKPAGRAVLLGPLAVESTGRAIDGLLLAGDAAGFIDPMTGDGLRFAVRGGELAAAAALEALEHGWTGVHDRLRRARRREFQRKWRFNRALRALVASSSAVRAASAAAPLAPGVVRALIARAGDCASDASSCRQIC